MDGRRNRGQYSSQYNGDAMRGVFGGMPRGMFNNEKRASIEGLAARQEAVAQAMERQQREKGQQKERSMLKRNRGAEAMNGINPANPEVPQSRDSRGMFPSISPRTVEAPPFPPGGGHSELGNNAGFEDRYGRNQRGRAAAVRRPPASAPGEPIATNGGGGGGNSYNDKVFEILSSVSSRLNANDDSVSSLQAHLSTLANSHSSMNMKVSSLPTSSQLNDLKQQLESNTALVNEASKKSNDSMVEVSKVSLQLFEQNNKLSQMEELSKDFEQTSMVLDSLRLNVDELKVSGWCFHAPHVVVQRGKAATIKVICIPVRLTRPAFFADSQSSCRLRNQ